MCANTCTHTQMHSLTMCFTGLSPTSFCRKLTLPFSLCHPAHPLSFHLACPPLPRSVTHQHPSLSHSPLYFFVHSTISSSSFPPISPPIFPLNTYCFCVFFSSCGPPLAFLIGLQASVGQRQVVITSPLL